MANCQRCTSLPRERFSELWWRQSLFYDQLVVRIGKTVPTYDFGNVVRPVPVHDVALQIPAVSGLLYTPVFLNPTMLGAAVVTPRQPAAAAWFVC